MSNRQLCGKRRCVVFAAIAISSLAIGACTTTGTGTAIAREPGDSPQEIEFSWTAGTDTSSGHIKTTMPDGDVFEGQFVQIKSETDVSSIAPFYDRWYRGWGSGWDAMWWPGPYDRSINSYVTVYSNRVLANLKNDEGETMRCVFRLANPKRGLRGGGIGECRTSEGVAIESAQFSPHDVQRR